MHTIKPLLLLLLSLAMIACGVTLPLQGADIPAPDPELQRLLARQAELEAAKEEVDAAIAAHLKKKYPRNPPTGTSPLVASDVAAQSLTKAMKAVDLKIRRSVKDSKTAELPALFQFTHPGSGTDSWMVDAGASIERDIADGIGFGAFGEYHYNDALGKLKDSVLTGASLDLVLRNHPHDENELPNTVLFRGTLSYKRDNLVSGEGLLTDLTLFPQVRELFLDKSFGAEETNGWFEGRIVPFVGGQYEEGNGAKNFSSGNRISLRAGVGLTVSLAPRYFGNRLTVESNFIYWNHFETSGGMEKYDESQWYWVTAVTYWFDTPGKSGVLTKADQHFGVSVGYTRGDNPDEGEFDADLLTVGFSVKF